VSEARIAIADDEESIRFVLSRALEAEGHRVESFAEGKPALAALSGGGFDLAIVDIRMPDLSGLDLLSRVREAQPDLPVLLVTAESTMANAIEAMKRGAFDYVVKPFDLDEVRVVVARALDVRRLTRMVEHLKDEVRPRYTPGEGLVGRTPAMQEIYKTIGRVAGSEATVLIHGESGTGKELIARALHFHSGRSGPFVAINCSAIPRELLESELFGHERGAFTGAVERRAGKFEIAGEGTLFLDEVGEMPTDLQAKLLRVIQEREFTRVGGRDTIRADVRIVAATNRDLEQEVRTGRFRDDLFFRLNVVPIAVPPLRERRADVPELIRFFLDKIRREMGTSVTGLAPDAETLLVGHAWPGNVRELENALVRASVLASGRRTLTAADFSLSGESGGRRPPDDAPLDELIRRRLQATLRERGERFPPNLHALAVSWIEKPLIELVLERTGGNQVKSAEILGINRNTLRKKISALGIPIRR
jgi:two-component system, NtrC family, nitrogen regulation response regulator GlnG